MPARPRKASKRRGDAAGQQRPSPEWGPVSDTVKRDARQFFAAAKRADRGSLTAGALAQAVQRSAFAARYCAAHGTGASAGP